MEACYKCKKIQEDILMLGCSHDLCLFCSSSRFLQSRQKDPKTNEFHCQFCSTKTYLDKQSVDELIKRALPLQQKKPIQKIPQPFEQLQKDLNISQQTIQIFMKQKINSIETLMLLSQQDYKQLKIPMGQRKRLLHAFKK